MTVVDDLLKNIPPNERAALEHIRTLVHKYTPDAEEVMTYGMPGFKYKGKYLLSFAAFKDHLSLFPGAEPIEVLRDELQDFKTSRGTIQFTIEKPLSDELLQQIIAICRSRIEK